MADDEVENPFGPQGAKPAMPNRGRRRSPSTIEGTAEDLTPESDPAGRADETAESIDSTAASEQAGPPPEDLAAAIGEPAGDPDAVDVAPLAVKPRSRMPLVVSLFGLIVIALLAAVLYGLYNPPADRAVADLGREVADLKTRLAAVEARVPPPTDLKPVQDRLAALEARPVGEAPDLKPLEDRIAALEGATTQLKAALADAQKAGQGEAAGAAPSAPSDLAPVEKQVADLQAGQQALREALAAAPKVDLGPLQKQADDLGARQKAIQDQVAALPRTDLGPLSGRVDDLGQKVAGVVAAVAAIPHVDLGPVDARVDALDKRLQPVEAALSAAKSQQQVTVARQNGSAVETRAAPLAITGQAIQEAISSGRPFAPELATLQRLGADAGAVAALKPVAEAGAPTQARLLAGFEDNQGRMVGATAPKPGGNVLDRMMAGAQSLVTVRPEGANPGQDPDAVVARIGVDLKKGEFARALDEWNGLPDDGKAATRAWADQLKARVQAEAAAKAVVAGAIAAIGSAP